MTSMLFLWIYDYILTLGDEVRYPCVLSTERLVLTVAQIKYAWSARRSWSKFPLSRSGIQQFMPLLNSILTVHCCMSSRVTQVVTPLTVVQNRYTPVLYIIWSHMIMHNHTNSVSPYARFPRNTILTKPPEVVRFQPFICCVASSPSVLTPSDTSAVAKRPNG